MLRCSRILDFELFVLCSGGFFVPVFFAFLFFFSFPLLPPHTLPPPSPLLPTTLFFSSPTPLTPPSPLRQHGTSLARPHLRFPVSPHQGTEGQAQSARRTR